MTDPLDEITQQAIAEIQAIARRAKAATDPDAVPGTISATFLESWRRQLRADVVAVFDRTMKVADALGPDEAASCRASLKAAIYAISELQGSTLH